MRVCVRVCVCTCRCSHHVALHKFELKSQACHWLAVLKCSSALTLQGFGYAVSLAGFFLYNYIKMQQMDQPQADSKAQYTALPQNEPDRLSNRASA